MALDDYRMALRGAVRGLWAGALDADQFHDQVRAAVNRELPIAWLEGSRGCGLESEEDYTPEEWTALGNAIQAELSHVADLALFVQQNDKAHDGTLETCLTRLDLWVPRYTDMQNQARLMVCGDEKLEWIYGDTLHCESCLALHGCVKRASYWRKVDVKPQSPPNYSLICQGWNCQCQLLPTDKPITKGPLPVVSRGFR